MLFFTSFTQRWGQQASANGECEHSSISQWGQQCTDNNPPRAATPTSSLPMNRKQMTGLATTFFPRTTVRTSSNLAASAALRGVCENRQFISSPQLSNVLTETVVSFKAPVYSTSVFFKYLSHCDLILLKKNPCLHVSSVLCHAVSVLEGFHVMLCTPKCWFLFYCFVSPYNCWLLVNV